MGVKTLDNKIWLKLIKATKLRDPGIAKAIDDYWDCKEPAFEGRLIALTKLLAHAKKMSTDKAVKAEREVSDYLKALIKDCTDEVRKTKADQKKYEAKAKKEGRREVNVQFVIKNFLNEPMHSHKAMIEFKAPGIDDIYLSKPIKGGVCSFKEIELMPVGTVRLLAVSTGKSSYIPTGVASYKLGTGKTATFNAKQGVKTVKVKARSLTEMTKKAGLKGSAGVEFKVVKIGGETSIEREQKKAREQSVEWEVLVGTGDFTVNLK